MLQELQITKELFETLNRFELDDLSILNEWDRHIEHFEQTEQSLNRRAFFKAESVEETVLRSIEYECLHRAINIIISTLNSLVDFSGSTISHDVINQFVYLVTPTSDTTFD